MPGTQTKYPASFLYADESDPGPYAVPLDAPIEGGPNATGDRHAIAVDTTNCILYELYRAFPQTSSWVGDSGAIFDLRSNALRPSTWTSADAAGLPIMPGLVTYEEVMSGEITHAIRFTAPQTKREFVWPARHYASSLTGTQYPRMGERFRLKASFDISPFPPEVQVIRRAMKKYGIMLADNGSAWFISGKPDSRWNNTNLRTLSQVRGSDFEAVDATVLRVSADSGEARQAGVSVSVAPSTAAVRVGHAHAFSATVSGGSSAVTWSVNDVSGGNSTVGLIDAQGLYSAPASVPSPATVTVRATAASSSASGTATVSIIPPPTITSVSPSLIQVGAFTLTVNGTGFIPGSVVSFEGTSLPTTVVSSSRLTATGSASTPKGDALVVVSTPDSEVSNIFTVSVVSPPAVTVSVSPASASVRVRQTQQFTATVSNTSTTAVTWKVNGITGGNTTVGTISASGLYRAPSSVPNPASVTVSATSVADPAKSASAVVMVRKK